jgi:hypothetical protein
MCLDGLVEVAEDAYQDSKFPGQEQNAGPSGYGVGALSTSPQRSVKLF